MVWRASLGRVSSFSTVPDPFIANLRSCRSSPWRSELPDVTSREDHQNRNSALISRWDSSLQRVLMPSMPPAGTCAWALAQAFCSIPRAHLLTLITVGDRHRDPCERPFLAGFSVEILRGWPPLPVATCPRDLGGRDHLDPHRGLSPPARSDPESDGSCPPDLPPDQHHTSGPHSPG